MQDPYHIILKSSDHMEDYVSMKKHVPTVTETMVKTGRGID